ncbi:ComF family protein [Halorubrum aidingense]|uniref:ComF family protein n=1 Tax=Halorubrum aidingense TaxID=368623 RepID=UPI001267212E|nr:hypothetical protein [Halorubrum aidingense]
MTTYEVIEENVEESGEFHGQAIWRPKYRCQKCSRAIKKSYTKTSGECYYCNNDLTAVGQYIDEVYAMTTYISDVEKNEFIEAIYDLKDNLEHISEFANILEQGFEDYPIADAELLVVPPSGTAESSTDNHMIAVAKEVSDRVEIPFRDIIHKREDYASQKELGLEERLDNLQGRIGCTEDSIAADKAIVIDDIATSCATVSATAQALVESGVSDVSGLVIARDEDIQSLEFANILAEVEG